MGKELKIEMSYLPVVNFAFQQNHVPVVREIKVANVGDEVVNDVEITLNFDPDFAVEYKTHLDMIQPGTEERISLVPVTISTDYLANLTERVLGGIRLTATSGDEQLVDNHYELSLLAFNEWGGSGIMPEITAAFSIPNHPALNQIIIRASEFLASWTGDPSFDDYQRRDPNRIKFQMAAIYEAISEKNIIYCTVPASFEDTGQRVRTVDEIFSSKMGNCFDMTMLYVSCLEAVGLHPLVVFVEGHAFAGCWLVPDSFADSVNDDPSLITKRMAQGINEILVVESTSMNSGNPSDFDRACKAGEQNFENKKFHYFLDISRARVAQIRPLPLRTIDENGRYVIEDRDIVRNADAPVAMNATDLIIDNKAEVNKQTIWERKLLDLSLRNNLLNLRITKGTVPFLSANVNEFEDALADNEDFRICPRPDDWDAELHSDGLYKMLNSTDPIYELVLKELSQNRIHSCLDEKTLRTSLTHLYRTSRTSMEENGANTLYLAMGLLKWYETPGSKKPRFAPILLIPVEIVRKSAASGYTIRSRGEETMLNITLLELLRQMFDISIGGLDPLPKDEKGIDTSLVFNTIRRKIMEQKGWDVLEQAILGNFSFNKFIMWNDIHNNSEELCKSEIVSSLMNGVVNENVVVDIEEEGDLDEKFKTGDIVLPISADSSQVEAITAAISGKSFILHGPPGTGKSQTITNIIANALYRGKKVLFVAEKMAALEVVQNRLNSIGLGPFCLELHSNKSRKSAVMEQLKRTVEVTKNASPEEYKSQAEHINAVRNEMNAYVKSLHRKHPLGVSLYDCISRYLSVDEACPLFNIPISKAEDMTAGQIADMEMAISELKSALGIIGTPEKNPLYGIGCLEYSTDVDNMLSSLAGLVEMINEYNVKVKTLLGNIQCDMQCPLREDDYNFILNVSILLANAEVYANFMSESDYSIDAIEAAALHGKEREAIKAQLMRRYDESILDIDAKAYEAEWRDVQSQFVLLRIFSEKKFLRKLGTYSKGEVVKDEVLELLKSVAMYKKENESMLAAANGNALMGSLIAKGNTDWEKVIRSCAFVREIKGLVRKYAADAVTGNGILTKISEVVEQGKSDAFVVLVNYKEELYAALQKAFGLLEAEQCMKDCATANEIKDRLESWISGKEKIRSWIMYNRVKNSINAIGFNEIIPQVDNGEISPDELDGAFHKSIYKSYAEYILTKEPELCIFHGVMFEEKVKRFRGLCKDFEKLTQEDIFANIAATLPALQKEASQSSEVGILQRNIRNGCRGTSLRAFFASIPNLLHRMCPCMLMSPISVAQYIEAGGTKFDLVIFDEASQMPTCEAVGTIARGNCIIVVGDPKQLPPTSFFASNTYDEENSHLEDMESILDECLALSLPSKHLRWHYRSKHESLIAFSNRKYYDNKLYTFPSPDDLTTRIGYQYVEGVYDRGGSRQNRAEAEAIINEIKRRLLDSELSKQSIGVVTFNTNQQSLLEDLLNDFFVKNPELEKIALQSEEPIFIKNLENVQGDERDVILFSIGYGVDKDGKVSLNFGPLNRDGGWRRLNVAVSRARSEMIVFSTLRSEQIDLKRTSAEGVAGLKEFLEYAERGKKVNVTASVANKDVYDGFVEAVAREIRGKGYEVKTNIGASGYKIDIGVVNPADESTYLIGILCDGYNYISSRSARDREIVQLGVLRRLGWNVMRLWAMDWWTDKEAVMERVLSMIDNVVAGEYVETEEEPIRFYLGNAKQEDDELVVYVAEDSGLNDVTPYEFASLRHTPLQVEKILNGNHDERITNYITTVVETEAPIREELLIKRVLRAVDIARAGAKTMDYMKQLIANIGIKYTVDDAKTLWRDEQTPEEYKGFRSSNERDALHIPYEEARNAAVMILDQQGAQPQESLVREMSKAFGYSRVGDNVANVMTKGIELAKKEQYVIEENGKLKISC